VLKTYLGFPIEAVNEVARIDHAKTFIDRQLRDALDDADGLTGL
jgi:hypothetical protein